MKNWTGGKIWLPCCAISLVLGACSDSTTSTGGEAPASYHPEIISAEFSAQINNTWIPMTPGLTYVYEGNLNGGMEHVEVDFLDSTVVIMGVECRVVHDRVWLDGELKEETWDWFAQHDDGSVWYFGEVAFEYEAGEVVSTAGSWRAGEDDALPGLEMPAQPVEQVAYRKEYDPGVAEDWAMLIAEDVQISVAWGNFSSCRQNTEWSDLDPDNREVKNYAEHTGLVSETEPPEDGSGSLELVSIRATE